MRKTLRAPGALDKGEGSVKDIVILGCGALLTDADAGFANSLRNWHSGPQLFTMSPDGP